MVAQPPVIETSAVPVEWIFDNRISYRARGLLAEMCTYPDEYVFTLAELVAWGPEGYQAIRTAVGELKRVGYVTDGGMLAANRCTVCQGVRPRDRNRGYTYAAERGGFLKIGRTDDLRARIKALSGRLAGGIRVPPGTEEPSLATLHLVWEGDREHDLHEQLADRHVVGEWFDLAALAELGDVR